MQGAGRAAPSAGSRVSASKATPTPPPPPLRGYLLPSSSRSHAYPHSSACPRSRDCLRSPVPPSPPPPGPDSFRPRGPICWEELPTPHLSSYFLAPIPGSAAVPSSRKPVLIEGRGEPTLPDSSPPTPLFQAAGSGEMPTVLCGGPPAPSSASSQAFRTDARTQCDSDRWGNPAEAGSRKAWKDPRVSGPAAGHRLRFRRPSHTQVPEIRRS